MNTARIAIVHERLTEIAGSEHVVRELARQWPDAKIFVPIARPEGIADGLGDRIVTSGLDKVYGALGRKGYAPLLPAMPLAFRAMSPGDVDAMIVSHHAFAIGAARRGSPPAIAYVHSPARWAWDATLRAGEADGALGSAALTALSAVARRGETKAAPRLASVIANSGAVAERIQRWWNRDAQVIHPPVDTEFFTPDFDVPREDFFLLAGRLVPYKRPDIAVLAANKAGVPLVVVGDGRYLEFCKSIAGETVTFLGRVSNEEMRSLHRRCRALLMPGVEDFGIVPVEAMACGAPVLALGEGGALDSVRAGVTGDFVATGSDDAVIDGFAELMKHFSSSAFEPQAIHEHALGFSRSAFREKMAAAVAAALR